MNIYFFISLLAILLLGFGSFFVALHTRLWAVQNRIAPSSISAANRALGFWFHVIQVLNQLLGSDAVAALPIAGHCWLAISLLGHGGQYECVMCHDNGIMRDAQEKNNKSDDNKTGQTKWKGEHSSSCWKRAISAGPGAVRILFPGSWPPLSLRMSRRIYRHRHYPSIWHIFI